MEWLRCSYSQIASFCCLSSSFLGLPPLRPLALAALSPGLARSPYPFTPFEHHVVVVNTRIIRRELGSEQHVFAIIGCLYPQLLGKGSAPDGLYEDRAGRSGK